MASNTKNTNLTWVYPINNWVSDYKQTFVYGWSRPNAKLFISVQSNKPRSIKIFPNGNFAQAIQLPNKKNIVKLIQILHGKTKTTIRYVIARNTVGAYGRKPLRAYHRIPQQKTNPIRFTKNNMVIVIDPGHGGKEHGTHSPKGIPEKILNLQIAKMIVTACGRMPFKNHLYLTRSTDKFLSLKNRINFAKKKKCNLFISIHHNALPDNENPLKHSGIGVYYMHDQIKSIAKKFLDNISKETKLKKYGIFKRDFAVTRPTFYTGLLIECGFLIHPTESEIITSKKIQNKIVKGIVKSIITTI